MRKHLVRIVLLSLVTTGFVAQCKKSPPPAPSAEQIGLVDVSAERALFNNLHLRVVIAVRIRPTAKVARVDFVHVSGYFVDQGGTSYTPGFTRVDNLGSPTREEIEPADIHTLRTGETYRYCLGPAEIAFGSEIKKVTVYLDGLQPKEVPVTKWADE